MAAAKLALYDAFLAAGITKVELARRLGATEGIVRRLLDPSHGSRLDAIDAAVRALGRRLSITLDDAA